MHLKPALVFPAVLFFALCPIRAGATEVEEGPATGHLGAVFRWDTGEVEAPEKVTLRFEPTHPGPSTPPVRSKPCPLTRDRLLCPLPAGLFDLRIQADDLVPIYVWSVEIRPGETTELGRLRWTTGGSIVGWVEIPHRDFDSSKVALELLARLASSNGSDGRARFRRQHLAATINSDGFFQLSGVRPGRYALLAKHPDFAPTRIDDVGVESGIETELAPFVLAEPAHLTVEIAPSTSPFTTPWSLRLTGETVESGYRETLAEGNTDDLGRWQLDGLAPAEIAVDIFDDRNNRWRSARFELHPGPNHHRVEIPFERLEGRLLLDDEPIVGARVRLEEVRGNTRIEATSRDEGRFYVFLSRDKHWDVEVSHEGLGVAGFFAAIEVPDKRPSERWPTRDFELPDTRFFGQVVEEPGRPTDEPVFLDLHGKTGHWTLQRRVAGGRFDLRGLPEGPVGIQARVDRSASSRSAKSGLTEVALITDVEVGPMELTLEDSRRLTGLVIDPGGAGVPGAKVLGLPEKVDGQKLDSLISQAGTDTDGVFDLDVPARTRFVQLTVFAPGFAATQQRIDLATLGDGPLILPIDSPAGTLVVDYDVEEGRVTSYHKAWTTLWGRGGLPESVLRPWIRLHGLTQPRDQLVIPMLEPGAYRVCFGSQALDWLATPDAPSGALADTACDEGQLAPGGTLHLEIPGSTIEAVIAAGADD